MSFIRIPSSSVSCHELPDVPSESEENARIQKTYWKSRNQVISTFVLCLGVFSLGCVFGWGVGAINDLKREGKVKFDKPVLASLFTIGALLSGPLAGYLMLRIGRKPTMFTFGVISVFGWAFILLAKALPSEGAGFIMYVGRFTCGFGTAACFTIAPVYVKETTDDAHRAVLSSMVTLSCIVGNFMGTVLSVTVSWFWTTVICIIFPIGLVVAMYWIPESPTYLIIKEKIDVAEKAFKWLAIGYDQLERERMFRKLRRIVDFTNANIAMRMSARRRMEERRKLKFSAKNVLRPAILGMVLIMLQQLTGCNCLLTYVIDVLALGGSSALDPNILAIVISFVFLVCVVIATFTVDKYGRKPFLTGSSLLMGLMTLFCAIFFIMVETGSAEQQAEALKNFSWVLPTSFCIYVAAYATGLGSVSWLVVTEINHPDFLETSGTLTVTVYWTFAYVTVQAFPAAWKAAGIAACFFFFSAMCFVAAVFAQFAVLETKGKSTDEVMQYYKGGPYALDDDDLDEATRSLGSIRKHHRHRHNSRGTGSRQSLNSEVSESEMVTLVEARDDGDKAFKN